MTWKYHILALSTYKGCYDVCSADDNINALKIFTCKAKLQLDKKLRKRLRYDCFNEKRVRWKTA